MFRCLPYEHVHIASGSEHHGSEAVGELGYYVKCLCAYRPGGAEHCYIVRHEWLYFIGKFTHYF